MKFIRSTWYKYSKLGRGRKKKQVWRSPKGRDNKMREKRKGKPQVVSIGFRQSENNREKMKGKNPVLINNLSDLLKMKKEDIGIVGSIGKKKKLEIAKKAKEKKYDLYNMNPEKYIKNNSKKKTNKNASNSSTGGDKK